MSPSAGLKLRAARQGRGLDGYERAKLLDGYPEREWSYNLFASRALMLINDEFVHQYFYESLSDFEQVVTALALSMQLRDAGVEPWALPDIGIGLKVFDSFFVPEHGHLVAPAPSERFHGRHSVALLSAYNSGEGDTLVLRNSRGRDWGDEGIGYVGRDWFEHCVDEAHIRRSLVIGPNVDTWDRWEAETTPEGRARTWMGRNSFHAREVWVCGDRHTLVQYETISFWRACIAEVIEIRDERGERMAWMHLFHEPGMTVVREFFVPPWNRHRGYGAQLEEIARSQAKYRERDRVRFTLDEADALPRNRDVAVKFLERRGYAWDWEKSERPNLVGFAERAV